MGVYALLNSMYGTQIVLDMGASLCVNLLGWSSWLYRVYGILRAHTHTLFLRSTHNLNGLCAHFHKKGMTKWRVYILSGAVYDSKYAFEDHPGVHLKLIILARLETPGALKKQITLARSEIPGIKKQITLARSETPGCMKKINPLASLVQKFLLLHQLLYEEPKSSL